MRPIPLLLIIPLLGIPVALSATPQSRVQTGACPQSAQKPAIGRALRRELGRATSNHVKIAKWRLTSLEVRARWALADVTPLSPRDLDSFTVLLHQTRGTWKILTLGTNLRGSGKQFKAPHALWQKWGL